MLKKSQTAIEFLILTTFVLFLLTIFFIVLNENISLKSEEAANKKITELAQNIQTEISLAHESINGYNRYFKIPLKINQRDYEIILTGNLIHLKTSDNKYAVALPILNVTGTLVKGDNLIKKQEDRVYINP